MDENHKDLPAQAMLNSLQSQHLQIPQLLEITRLLHRQIDKFVQFLPYNKLLVEVVATCKIHICSEPNQRHAFPLLMA